jgi:hypothetical protein
MYQERSVFFCSSFLCFTTFSQYVLAQSRTLSSFVLAPTEESLFSTQIIEMKRDFFQNQEKESNLPFLNLH